MGQPGKSIPDHPIQSREDFVDWVSSILGTLKIDKANLMGMSYGGWVALNYALGAPERVEKCVLLSPAGGFIPLVSQFMLRAMPMLFLPGASWQGGLYELAYLHRESGGSDNPDDLRPGGRSNGPGYALFSHAGRRHAGSLLGR